MANRKSLHFFATKGDLQEVLTAVESERHVAYVKAGMSESPDKQQFASGLEIPDLGTARAGDQNQQQWYLVVNPGVDIMVEAVPQRRGGTRYAIDQKMNSHSVAFRPGGVFEPRCVIPGQIGTSSDDEGSKELLNLFVKEFRRRFTRIKSYYVGPEAAKLLDSGYRLTADARSSLDYDLAR